MPQLEDDIFPMYDKTRYFAWCHLNNFYVKELLFTYFNKYILYSQMQVKLTLHKCSVCLCRGIAYWTKFELFFQIYNIIEDKWLC